MPHQRHKIAHKTWTKHGRVVKKAADAQKLSKRVSQGKVDTFREQQDVIKEVVNLRRGLQQADHDGSQLQVSKIAQALDDLEGGAAV